MGILSGEDPEHMISITGKERSEAEARICLCLGAREIKAPCGEETPEELFGVGERLPRREVMCSLAAGAIRAAGLRGGPVGAGAEQLVAAGERGRADQESACAAACSRSAMRSAGSSIPTERRIKSGPIPSCSRSGSGTEAWVIVSG